MLCLMVLFFQLKNYFKTKNMKKSSEIIFNKLSDDVLRYSLLNFEQTCLLKNVMETSVPIHGTGNFPTLETSPAKLIQVCLLYMQL